MTNWAGVELPLKMVSATGLTFVPLTPALVEQDYTAVMRDIPMLRAWSGQDWPTDDFPIEANLADLVRHDREQQEGVALTYSVLLDEAVQGCIYVRPLADALATREVAVPPDATGALADIVVRGWLHARPAVDLIRTTVRLLTTGELVAGRLWWQTNSACPDQLAACDELGLTDALTFDGGDCTWVLRSAPTA